MKQGWEYKKLKDCLLPYTLAGSVKKRDYLPSGEYPIVSQEEELISGYTNDASQLNEVISPIIIYGDHTQHVKLIDFSFAAGADGTKILYPKEFLLPKYLFYFIQGNRVPSLGYARHFRHLKEVSVSIPPIEEQQRIVAVLDEAFDGLETARTNAEENLKNAEELFQSNLQLHLGDDTLQQGRELKTLGEVAEFAPKKRVAKETLDEEASVSFVPMESLCVGNRSLLPTNERTLASVYSNYTYFADGDVLLAKITPCFENGKLGVASGLTNGVGFGSSEFMVIRPSRNVIPEYIYYFLDRNTFRQWARQRMTGAVGHKRVPKELVTNLQIPLPTLGEQKRIVDVLDGIKANVSKLSEEYSQHVNNITNLRQSLLQKAFAGELT